MLFGFVLEIHELDQSVDIGVPATEKPRIELQCLPDRILSNELNPCGSTPMRETMSCFFFVTSIPEGSLFPTWAFGLYR